MPTTDNVTRISSTQRMDYAFLACWEPSRKVCASPAHYGLTETDLPKPRDRVTIDEKEAILEIEGVLAIVRIVTIVSQCEKYFVAAYGLVLKLFCLSALRAGTIRILGVATLGTKKHARIDRKVLYRGAVSIV